MKTKVKVEFGDIKFGNKTVLPLVIKGDLTDGQILALTKLASAKDGFAVLSSAQMDMEDYDDRDEENVRDGVGYRQNSDGTVDVDRGKQLTIEDAAAAAKADGEKVQAETGDETVGATENESTQEQPGDVQSTSDNKVTDMEQARGRRGRPKKEKEADKAADDADKEGNTDAFADDDTAGGDAAGGTGSEAAGDELREISDDDLPF